MKRYAVFALLFFLLFLTWNFYLFAITALILSYFILSRFLDKFLLASVLSSFFTLTLFLSGSARSSAASTVLVSFLFFSYFARGKYVIHESGLFIRERFFPFVWYTAVKVETKLRVQAIASLIPDDSLIFLSGKRCYILLRCYSLSAENARRKFISRLSNFARLLFPEAYIMPALLDGKHELLSTKICLKQGEKKECVSFRKRGKFVTHLSFYSLNGNSFPVEVRKIRKEQLNTFLERINASELDRENIGLLASITCACRSMRYDQIRAREEGKLLHVSCFTSNEVELSKELFDFILEVYNLAT